MKESPLSNKFEKVCTIFFAFVFFADALFWRFLATSKLPPPILSFVFNRFYTSVHTVLTASSENSPWSWIISSRRISLFAGFFIEDCSDQSKRSMFDSKKAIERLLKIEKIFLIVTFYTFSQSGINKNRSSCSICTALNIALNIALKFLLDLNNFWISNVKPSIECLNFFSEIVHLNL